MMRASLILPILCAALLLTPEGTKAEIIIGVAGPASGENANFGEQMKRGAEQAAADINAAGGVHGETLKVKFFDDACDPKQAVTVANQIVSAGIHYVVGHACSGSSIPASKIYNEEGVFMVTPLSSNPELTDAGLQNVFRVCGRDDQQGVVTGDYILRYFHGKNVAILHNQSAWGQGLAVETQKELNRGGVKEKMFEAFTPSSRDYSALVTKLKQANIDVVFIGGYYTEVGLIVRQLKDQGAHIQVIGGDALMTDQFWSITGPLGEGVLMSFGPDARNISNAKPVLGEFRSKGYEPDGYTLYSYAAVQVIAEGLKRADKVDVTLLSKSLRSRAVETVLGHLAFDDKGDRSGSTYVIYRWHDGHYAEVKP